MILCSSEEGFNSFLAEYYQSSHCSETRSDDLVPWGLPYP